MERYRKVLRCKIHRATVTAADVNYEGSVSIDPALLQAADLVEYEAVNIWNVTNGERFQTYAIRGRNNSGDICINGAAAHKASPGDIIIIAAFCYIDEQERFSFKPKLVFVESANNKKFRIDHEIPGPLSRKFGT